MPSSTLTALLYDRLGLDPAQRQEMDGRVASGIPVAEALAVGDDRGTAAALAEILGLELAIAPGDLLPDAAWLKRIPLRVWAAARALPLAKGSVSAGGADDRLVVAVADPLDAPALDPVRVATSRPVSD